MNKIFLINVTKKGVHCLKAKLVFLYRVLIVNFTIFCHYFETYRLEILGVRLNLHVDWVREDFQKKSKKKREQAVHCTNPPSPPPPLSSKSETPLIFFQTKNVFKFVCPLKKWLIFSNSLDLQKNHSN